jgi:hypothetical protein
MIDSAEPIPDPDDPPRPRSGRRPAELALVPVVPPAAIPEPPSGAVLQVRAPVDPARRHWFVAQLWAEFVLVLRMYVDPRYRISRTAQLLVPTILVLFVVNYFLFSAWLAIPVVSPVLERLLDLLLGIILYKLLARELARYREVLDYLSRFGPR